MLLSGSSCCWWSLRLAGLGGDGVTGARLLPWLTLGSCLALVVDLLAEAAANAAFLAAAVVLVMVGRLVGW